MYHKIYPDSPTIWWVTVNDFYRQMHELRDKKVVYLDEYDKDNPQHVVITFDGVYKNIAEFAMPILKHFNYPFELFVTSEYIGRDNEFDSSEPPAAFASLEELKTLVKCGGRLQWHTQSHKNLKEVISEFETLKELEIPLALLQADQLGFNWFAYPYGDFNDATLQAVSKKFKGAVSCNQGDNSVFQMNRLTVENITSFKKNTVGCIIASYNYGGFLIEAVESVLRQTIVPDEILISDDCSTDDTKNIAEAYVKKYPRLIKYNRNNENLGIVAHFNKAIGLTQSDLIMILGADNRLLSNYVEECSAILNTNENIAIAYTDFALFGERAKIVSYSYQQFSPDYLESDVVHITFPVFSERTSLIDALRKENFIHGSSLFRRTAFEKVGGYIKSEIPEDYNLFLRMLHAGFDIAKAPKTCLEYRQHSGAQANHIANGYQQAVLFKSMLQENDEFKKSKTYKLAWYFFKARRMSLKELLKKVYYKLSGKK